MPNWCECELYVRTIDKPESDSKELQRFKIYASENATGDRCTLLTDKFIPYPDKFKEMDRKHQEESKKWQRCSLCWNLS